MSSSPHFLLMRFLTVMAAAWRASSRTGAAATWTRRKRDPRIDVSCAMPSSAAFRVAASAENVWISVFMTASGFGCCAAIFVVGAACRLQLSLLLF